MSPSLQSDYAKLRTTLVSELNKLKQLLNTGISSTEHAAITEEISKINEEIGLLNQYRHKNPAK